jgi:cytochrome P450
MDRVGLQLVREKKAAVANEGSDSLKNSRDLLSLLIRANMSEDPSQRLSDYDVMAREYLTQNGCTYVYTKDANLEIPTFIIAGHETTANALTWAIFALCQRPDIQDRLREELRSLPLSTTVNDNAAFTQEDLAALDKLPLLDAVVRETLRVHAPVPSTSRVAMQDDEIPVSHPYTDRNGILRNSIPMEKGTEFPVLILAVNRSKDIWGPDALEWSPDRWLQGVPEGVKSIPGVWGPLLTFINGSHACIGFRFALIEMKVILHAIASEFHFKLGTDPSDVIKRSTGLVYRPFLKSEKEKGVQLPVLVSRVPRD